MTYIAEDGLPENRMTCTECRKAVPERSWCDAFKTRTMMDLKRRCVFFIPLRSIPDQRTGTQRWPDIVEQIEEVRKLEREARG